MKIIVKESQYNLIKEFIEEVKGKSYSRGVMANLGRHITNLLKNISQGKETEFTLANSVKVVLKCLSDDNNVYKFQVIEDENNVFDGVANLAIKINPGNGDPDRPEDEYNKNTKIIKAAQNANNYTLIFTGLDGQKKTIELQNIASTKVVTLPEQPKQEEPKPEEPKPEEPTNDKSKEKNLTYDAKAAYDRILSDPKLKDAFYKQPTFWQAFMAELTGKKPKGSGIITALDILNKYDLRRYDELIGNKFIPNQKVTIKFLENYQIDTKENKTIKFNKNIEYILKVRPRKSGKQILDGENYYIVVSGEVDDENLPDTFYTEKGKIKYNFTVIEGEKSPGYKPEN